MRLKCSLSEIPRKLLVGGMRAQKIIIATPLLKWYIDHERHISKNYQVIEFTKSRCFKNVVSQVRAMEDEKVI